MHLQEILKGEINIQIVTISFFRFQKTFGKIWAFSQMGLARRKLKKIEQLLFFKLFGSGTGEGFTPVPNTNVYAILCVWQNTKDAEVAIQTEEIFQSYKKVAIENWTVFLTPISSRGNWDKKNPFLPAISENLDKEEKMLAALTRATIKPRIMLNFWSRVPAISKMIGKNKDVIFKMGLGEIPWFHQVTFSIWPNETSMCEFARKDGPHAKAIESVRKGNWFSEELYARFKVQKAVGTWDGRSMLNLINGTHHEA